MPDAAMQIHPQTPTGIQPKSYQYSGLPLSSPAFSRDARDLVTLDVALPGLGHKTGEIARSVPAVSLREHLRSQLNSPPLSERERLAAEAVIDALDDDGYLRTRLRDSLAIAGNLPPLSTDELESAIKLVQELEPAGVGARDLGECLMLQLLTIEHDRPGRCLAMSLVQGGLDLLARRDWSGLQRRFDCSEASLRLAHGLIRRLDTRPGCRYARAARDFIVPDVIVLENRGQMIATINPALLPRKRRSHGQAALERHYDLAARDGADAHATGNARNSTILRVAEVIVRKQHAFFVYGEIALRPLSLRQIADELGLHESTISRATGNKYMATPRGLFEFRHFLPRELATDSGEQCSSSAVRALLREMIDAEPASQPLSDVVLARRLTERGIRVARRTVAKYRAMMKLPPAELRRAA